MTLGFIFMGGFLLQPQPLWAASFYRFTGLDDIGLYVDV
jgi:hypothetical protein